MTLPPPPPPPGLNYIAVISPVLRSVLLGRSFLVLLPLVYGLLFFSTPKTRRQPVFVLNVFNICLAVAVGITLDYRGVRLTLDPLSNFGYPFDLSISILGIIQSLLINVGRAINLILLSKTLVALGSGPNAGAIILQKWAHAPYTKLEWFRQLIDVR
ncbi:hypothetical protein HETIRDRAFT_419810 [Heterobasidion irregulare TC 32-1]|uniref:Uncharacterized protein n=1 Tax=Heterobasidion irregulare (strain TC 32-1) TaxID=747525 RepID=W4JYL4_HETIT|nr:uncharacterized protein HETIRDRAFT_419810 [Heterobasidion irregulare TC 32-1]ETW78539.1 hypothetical protein HETIRDRAFT_419810 [Heterobasidion irregulare TC 32-1]